MAEEQTISSNKRTTPKRPLTSEVSEAIEDSCQKRIEVLTEQLKMMREEHNKEMEIKEYKLLVLKEKYKYWQRMNNS